MHLKGNIHTSRIFLTTETEVSMNKPYRISEETSIQILAVHSLLDEWENRHLYNEFQQYINQGIQQFIIDLSKLPIINSVGINFLLRLLRKVQQIGGQLFLSNASTQVLHLLDITKLTTIFSIEESVEDAVEAIEGEEVIG